MSVPSPTGSERPAPGRLPGRAPGPRPRARAGPRPVAVRATGPRVIVLGAGVAGLVAAYELEQFGYRVEVVESGTRVGGRVRTHRFGAGPGAPAVELGAMRIPSDHHRTLGFVRRLRLEGRLREFATLLSEENAYVRTTGGFVRVHEAARPLREDFRRELARLGPGRRHSEPALAFAAWLAAVVDAIAPPDMRAALREDLHGQLLDLVKHIDLSRYVRGAAGERVDLHALFSAHPDLRAGCSARLGGFLDDILTETGPGLLRLEGGMDLFTSALASRLRGAVRCGHRVTGLHVRDEGVLVHIRAGARTLLHRAELAVCTLPFPALRGVRLTGFDADKLAVLDEVEYCPATKVAFHCREPFWWDGGIRGGASFTGGGIRQTYYPPVDGDPRRGAALLASYTIGEEAARLGRLPAHVRHALVLEELSALHPELRRPGMVLAAVSEAWGSAPWSAGCATRWGKSPAACERERARAARPVGPLFFAGEHCAARPAWIEGAVESALAAVEAIAGGEVSAGHPGAAVPALTTVRGRPGAPISGRCRREASAVGRVRSPLLAGMGGAAPDPPVRRRRGAAV
ncbi:flavin monoamine oxidase family protein [Streptomyces gamaensis]|uniref:Flavin monoamine oxidase family protein n=1 Tax=Streptomyces gamaensis TaxID=1763542 RepID=A0ABW0YT43_9ACTN